MDALLGNNDQPAQSDKIPASADAVTRLERCKICVKDLDENSTCCPISLDEFTDEEEAIRLPCSHVFKTAAILEWLGKHHTCPVCRHELEAQKRPTLSWDLPGTTILANGPVEPRSFMSRLREWFQYDAVSFLFHVVAALSFTTVYNFFFADFPQTDLDGNNNTVNDTRTLNITGNATGIDESAGFFGFVSVSSGFRVFFICSIFILYFLLKLASFGRGGLRMGQDGHQPSVDQLLALLAQHQQAQNMPEDGPAPPNSSSINPPDARGNNLPASSRALFGALSRAVGNLVPGGGGGLGGAAPDLSQFRVVRAEDFEEAMLQEAIRRSMTENLQDQSNENGNGNRPIVVRQDGEQTTDEQDDQPPSPS
jgi:hypothetical protein